MKNEIKNWGILILLGIIWGSSFFLIKRGLYDQDSGNIIFSSTQVGALRMLIASLVLLPIGMKYILKPRKAKIWIALIIVGFLGNFLPALFFSFAETGISSGFAGMLNSGTPIFTIFLGTIIFKQKLIGTQVVGVLIGSAGMIWLVNSVSIVEASGSFKHVLAVVLATICYATSVNTIRYILVDVKPLEVTATAFSLTFIPALFLFFWSNTPTTIMDNPNALTGLGYLTILAVLGTAISVILFNQLIQQSSALFASTVTYIIPIVALFIGLLDGEQLYLQQLLAVLVILSGVFMANVLARRKLKKEHLKNN